MAVTQFGANSEQVVPSKKEDTVLCCAIYVNPLDVAPM